MGGEAIDPAAYVIDDSGFPKDGAASPCVARQYSGTLGKTGNCQIGVSVQLASDTASVAADSGYGDCTLFRLGLAERGLRYGDHAVPLLGVRTDERASAPSVVARSSRVRGWSAGQRVAGAGCRH